MGVLPSGAYLAKKLLLDAADDSGQWWWTLVLQGGAAFTAAYVVLVRSACCAAPRAPPAVKPVSRLSECAALALAVGRCCWRWRRAGARCRHDAVQPAGRPGNC